MPGISKYAPVEEHVRQSDPHPQYAKKAELSVLVKNLGTTTSRGQGLKGDKGDKGDDGDTGPQGPPGATQGIIDGGVADSTYGPGGLLDCGGA